MRAGRSLLLGTAGVLAAVALWQLVSMTGLIDPLLFPSPLATADALAGLVRSGELTPHVLASARLLLVGFALGVVVGFLLGLAAGWFELVEAALSPHVALIYATPALGLMPLFIAWFGLGFASHVAVVFLLSLFPSYFAALDAVRDADASLVRVARAYGGSGARIFRAIILPGSVPYFLSGLRLSFGKALVGVIFVELYASEAGLGKLLIVFGNTFRTPEVFAVIVVIAIIGLVATVALRLVEARFDSWRVQPNARG